VFALAAFAKDHLLAIGQDLRHWLVRRQIDHDGTQRQLEHNRLAIAAVAVRTLAVFATLGFPMRLVFVIDEIVRVDVAHEHHVTPAAAVTSIRPAPGFVFFPAKTNASPATIARRQLDCALVDKHAATMHNPSRLPRGRSVGRADRKH
jgi:hypothetical protein